MAKTGHGTLSVEDSGPHATDSMTSEQSDSQLVEQYTPRTELGRRLWSIRQRIIASGATLMSAEEIDQELASRRGERDVGS